MTLSYSTFITSWSTSSHAKRDSRRARPTTNRSPAPPGTSTTQSKKSDSTTPRTCASAVNSCPVTSAAGASPGSVGSSPTTAWAMTSAVSTSSVCSTNRSSSSENAVPSAVVSSVAHSRRFSRMEGWSRWAAYRAVSSCLSRACAGLSAPNRRTISSGVAPIRGAVDSTPSSHTVSRSTSAAAPLVVREEEATSRSPSSW